MEELPVKLIGVYSVDENPDISLVELNIAKDVNEIDFFEFTQEVENEPRLNWQVPFGEVYLDPTGEKVIGDEINLPKGISGNTRLAFFIYYLDVNKPMLTPFGKIILFEKIEAPNRIKAAIKFIDPE